MTPQTDAELERIRSERNLILSRLHKRPKQDTGAWYRGECAPGCDACRFLATEGDFERLVRADERAVLKMNKAHKCITEHFRKRTKLR